jgi:hypothetical protein
MLILGDNGESYPTNQHLSLITTLFGLSARI